MKRKSKGAFEHNLKAELTAGKPKDQALAIAYSVKRKAKKASGGTVESGSRDMDMADGGKLNASAREHIKTKNFAGPDRSYPIEDESHARNALARVSQHGSPELQAKVRAKVHKKYPGIDMKAEGGSISASNEKRPMPDDLYDDSELVGKNHGNKAPAMGDDAKTQDDISYQAKKGLKTTRIKHPKMVASDIVQARLRDEEDDLMDSAGPNEGPQRQPPEYDNEERPNRQGPHVPDMEDEHATHRKPYAKGGEVEASDYDHHADGRYEDDLQDLKPSEDEGAMNARSHSEEGPDRQGDEVPDTEEPHSEHDEMYHDNMHDDSTKASDTLGRSASGGMDQDEEEEAIDHAASVAAAIMMKRKKMAEGGEILHDSEEPLSHGSMNSDDSDQADLRRNAEEDANEEDQASFDALRKENYSESEGLRHMDSPEDSNEHSPEHEEEDVHDSSLVSAIRSKMKKKSAMTR